MKALEYHNGGGNAIATTTGLPPTTTGEPAVLSAFKRFAGTTATFRALDGAELYDAGLTFRQAKRRAGASYGYVCTAIALSAEERDLVRAGVKTLAGFHKARPVSNRTIDRLIREAGFDRVYARLDRMTRPSISIIAAE